MKKSFSIFVTIILATLIIFLECSTVFALETLDTVTVDLSKAKIAPGEEVTVTINFGKPLGAYTVQVAYDNAVFDYVSTEGGTANNEGTDVKFTYYDTEGGSNPRTSASITFKAKDTIVASTPTDFSITLEGLSNPDNSIEYEDITQPIKENILVEPNYVDYTLTLEYDGVIMPNVAKAMKLVTASTMGKNYDKVRLLAEVTKKPSDDATVKLLARNEQEEDVDLIKSGWGDADGYELGGKNVKQEINLQGEFSKEGSYSINVKLIDRGNSDTVIAQKTFEIKVGEQPTPTKAPTQATPTKAQNNTNVPSTLPKTGNMQYVYVFFAITALIVSYFILTRKNNKNNK